MSRVRNADFVKRLIDTRNEGADVLARMNRRSRARMMITMQIIVSSVALEVVAVAYAVASALSTDLNWMMRAFRVLPMLLFPNLSASVIIWACDLSQILCQREEEAVERFRAETNAKVGVLMGELNHRITQDLIEIRMKQMLLDLVSLPTEPGEEIDLHEDLNTVAEESLRQLRDILCGCDTHFCVLDRYHLVVRPLPCYDDLQHRNSLSVFVRDTVGLE